MFAGEGFSEEVKSVARKRKRAVFCSAGRGVPGREEDMKESIQACDAERDFDSRKVEIWEAGEGGMVGFCCRMSCFMCTVERRVTFSVRFSLPSTCIIINPPAHGVDHQVIVTSQKRGRGKQAESTRLVFHG